ncbi:hypothetical protein VTP01DRAFT_6163 [Rhizomucor pusillus]|uniref:uncharacterized protein n=1 Tax=Rhizomucor pusillus TaxID=4840 RepID=UPI0037443D5A
MAQNRREQVQQRRAQPDHQRDLLILILEGELDGIHGLSTDEKPRICTTLYIYNYITRQMLICIHLWSQNNGKRPVFCPPLFGQISDKRRNAREEVIKLLGDDSEDVLPTLERLKQVKHIDMIIKEPKGGARHVRRDLCIPKDAAVSVDILPIQRYPDMWVNPDEYIPEKFHEGAEVHQQNDLTWLPFSNGGRQCIGMNFNIAEEHVALSMLLRKFELTLPEDSIHRD